MADTPIAYQPVPSGPRASARYYMSTGGAFFDTTAKEIQFKATAYAHNMSQYLSFDATTYKWTVLADCTLQINMNVTCALTTSVDNRCTAKHYMTINGQASSQSNCFTYHRISTTTNDETTANMNLNYEFSIGDEIQFWSIRVGGTAQLACQQFSSISFEVISETGVSSAGFIPSGPAGSTGWMLRWNGSDWEATDQMRINEPSANRPNATRGLVYTGVQSLIDVNFNTNSVLEVVEELPVTPNGNTIYFVIGVQ